MDSKNGQWKTDRLKHITYLPGYGMLLKRAFDLVSALFGLIILSPIFALIGIAIKRDSPGPVFFRGRRMGFGGKEFHILKFRTMYETPESYTGPKVTASDDVRITPLGRWLRSTKLNELPQLWNVLKGEMSLIGPRPEDPDIARSWPEHVFTEVCSVRPGITSPASVLYRNEETLLCAENFLRQYFENVCPDKMRLDQLYVRYRSFVLDMDVLFWTFLILIPKLHTYSPPETLLFIGPITRFIRRYLNWFVIDLIITIFALSSMGIIYRIYSPLNLGWAKSLGLTIGFALLFSITEAIFGVNRIAWSKATFANIYDLLIAWLISTTIVIFVNTQVRAFPLGLVIGASLLAAFGFVVVRYRSRLMVEMITWVLRFQKAKQLIRERVLIIGSNHAGQHAAWLLSHPANAQKFWVVGFVDNDYLRQDMRLYGMSVLGTVKDVPGLIKKHKISMVLVADHQEYMNDFMLISTTCAQSAAKLVVLPDMLSTLNGLAGKNGATNGGNAHPVAQTPSRGTVYMPIIPDTGALESTASRSKETPCAYCLVQFGTQQLEMQLDLQIQKINAGDMEDMRTNLHTIKTNSKQR